VFVSVFGFAAPLCAQSNFELAPLFGYYQPFGSFAPASVYYTSLPTKPSGFAGAAWGAEAHLGLSRRLGVRIQAAVVNSSIPQTITPEGPRGPTAAQVVIVTAQAQYDLSPKPGNYRMWVSAGPGLVRHGGDAYANIGAGSPANAAAALGVGLDIPIVSRLRGTVGAETLFYQMDVPMPPESRLNPGSLERGFQIDALVHVGLAWGWR
jgi:hypothetical protein